MKELSKQTIKYLYMMRTLNSDLYKKMIVKINVSDEKILSKVTDLTKEEIDDYLLDKKKKEINPNIKSDDKWSKVYFWGGKPYLGDASVTQIRKDVSSNTISCVLQKTYNKGYSKEHGKKAVLKKVYVFIDGENIGAQYVEKILEKISEEFEIQKMKCYIRKNEGATVPWLEAGKEHDLKVVQISGQPKKDKIDNIIKHDVQQIINNNKLDAICIVASDGGYVDIVNEIKSSGKEAVIVGEEKTPERLRMAATRFIKLSRR